MNTFSFDSFQRTAHARRDLGVCKGEFRVGSMQMAAMTQASPQEAT